MQLQLQLHLLLQFVRNSARFDLMPKTKYFISYTDNLTFFISRTLPKLNLKTLALTLTNRELTLTNPKLTLS